MATAKSLITGKNVKNGSLTGRDIKNRSIKNRDIGKRTLKLDRLSKGTQKLIRRHGARGPAGPRGATGGVGPGGSGGANVTSQGSGFTASNPSVKFGNDGAKFGPYTNNSAGDKTSGGTVRFTGVPAGTTLQDIAELTYSASYTHDDTKGADNGDAPYLRVFTTDSSGVDRDVIFSPSTQPNGCAGPGGGGSAEQCKTSGRLIEYEVTKGTVRYDNDEGSVPDSPWSEVINAHKTDKVTGIYVSVGNSLPGTKSGTLNSLRTEFQGSPPRTYSFSG